MSSGVWRQYLASTICQLSALFSGLSYSWFEPLTEESLSMTTQQLSWVISVIEISAMISPFISGELINRIGRKNVIIATGPFCLVGWLMMLHSKSFPILICARILHGVAVGITYTVPPIYTAEIAEPRVRGTLAGMFIVLWYLGALIAFSIGPYLSYENYIYACLPLPVVFIFTFLLLPETPYYLVMKGHSKEARISLEWFRKSKEVEEELLTIETNVREEMEVENSWTALFTDKKEKKAFFILLILYTTHSFAGLNIVETYALDILSQSVSVSSPKLMSIFLCAFLASTAVIGAFMSDKFGRRPLVLISTFGCFASHLLTGTYCYIDHVSTVDASPYVWMMYAGLPMFCFFSSIGLGPLVQILQAEMFSARTRGVAGGITQCYVGLLFFVCLKIYSPINEMYGLYANFFIYCSACLIGGIILWCVMYETKGNIIGRSK